MYHHDIIVIGTSAGGVKALLAIVQQLPARLPASIFVALHISPDARSELPAILTRAGTLPVQHPADGTRFQAQHMYIAPPDHHMLIEANNVISITQGPPENHYRPAINLLFRSAALYYTTRVIGVVLTGALDDGTAGLLSIKEHGGITVIQDPEDAAYPDMPNSALHTVPIDYQVPIAEMGTLLMRLAQEPACSEQKKG